jgi:hypothetical protein
MEPKKRRCRNGNLPAAAESGLTRRVTRRRPRFSIDQPLILLYTGALIALGCGDAHLTVTSY